MKIALLGNGRTGGRVHDVIDDADSISEFNEENQPTVEKLQNYDVIICFLPGDAFLEHYQTLIDAKVPVVTGSTGFEWPVDANSAIEGTGVAWITANNFSMGMQLVHDAIVALGSGIKLLPEAKSTIHEIHHIHKKDSPSGTALKWEEWLGQTSEITSERTGDIVGDHTLTIETPSEKIVIQHIAKDRSLFASGAVWAARRINELEPGLHYFENVVNRFKQGKTS